MKYTHVNNIIAKLNFIPCRIYTIILLFLTIYPIFTLDIDTEFEVNQEFFSLHIRDGDMDNLPFRDGVKPFKGIRLWDSAMRWQNLEPAKGKFFWDELDAYVDKATRNNIDIILVLGTPPKWAAKRKYDRSPYGHKASPSEPANMSDWSQYVAAIATRYKGKIKYWEIWNEPDIWWFYTGSIKTMVKLTAEAHRVLKSIDKDNMIITPSIAGWKGWGGGLIWLDIYLNMGGKNYIDIVSFHLYSSRGYAPEAMIYHINAVKRIAKRYGLANKPIWNTETCYHYKNITKNDIITEYISRMYLINAFCEIERVYWYSWDFCKNYGGMQYKDTKDLTPEGLAYQTLYSWLNGKKIIHWHKTCSIWICTIDNNGATELILWTPYKTKIKYTATDNISSISRLDGTTTPLDSKTIYITDVPILLK